MTGYSRPILRRKLSREQICAFYDKYAEFYDALAERSEHPVLMATLEYLDAQAGERILEIGCGTGHALSRIAAATGTGGFAVGLDLSSGRLNRARSLAARESGGNPAEFVRADALHLPFHNESFDAICTTFTIELFDTPEIPRLYDECRRVLRPGGRLAAASLSEEGSHHWGRDAYEWVHQHFPSLANCRPIYLLESLDESGFEIVQSKFMTVWLPMEVVLAAKPVPDLP